MLQYPWLHIWLYIGTVFKMKKLQLTQGGAVIRKYMVHTYMIHVASWSQKPWVLNTVYLFISLLFTDQELEIDIAPTLCSLFLSRSGDGRQLPPPNSGGCALPTHRANKIITQVLCMFSNLISCRLYLCIYTYMYSWNLSTLGADPIKKWRWIGGWSHIVWIQYYHIA